MEKDLDNLITVINSYGYDIEQGKAICCPLHDEDTASFHINTGADGEAYWKCFGCDKGGDMYSFVMEMDNIGFAEAKAKVCEILGVPNNDTPSKLTKFKEAFAKVRPAKADDTYHYDRMHLYMNDNNDPVIGKVIWKNDSGKKEAVTYKIIDKGDYYQYGTKKKLGDYEYVVYNYPKVKEAIDKGYPIYFVEGEKDADNLIRLGKCATTIISKNNNADVWEKYQEQLRGAKIVFIGDTGNAGKKFRENCWNNLRSVITSFKVVTLPGIEELGDNKDITDWLEAGHTKDELIMAVRNSLDLLDKNQLQQDNFGIYKTVIEEKGKGDDKYTVEKKVYLTDFNVISAGISRNIDTDDQEISITIKNSFGKMTTISEDARTLFNEIKNFRSALGIDYNFSGKMDDLITLKKWIVRYFVRADKHVYQVTGIRNVNGEYALVTNNGILYKDGRWDTSITADNVFHDIDFTGIGDLTKEEAEELAQHLLTFNSDTVVYNTLGAGLSQMLNSFVRDSKKDNLPVLFNIGESNAGKSKAQHILKLLFNNTKGALGFNVITPFTLQKAMGDTYLPLFVDEIKPSKDGGNKKMLLSRIVRSATEGYTNFKGTQSQKLNQYETNACLILTGEDGTDETAVVNRTNTVRYSRINFTETGEKSIEYLCSSSRGEELLRKLSKQLYLYVLNNYDAQVIEVKYDIIKNNPDYPLEKIVDDRIRKTAIYTIMGLELLNDTFTKLGVELLMFGFTLDMVAEAVVDNLIEEVNDGGDTALAEYEKILLDIDHLAGNVDIAIRLREGTDYKVTDDGDVAIIIPAIWDKLEKYYKSYKTGNIPLDKGTFIKTLKNSKYYKDYKPVTFKDYEEAVDGSKHARWKTKKAYILNAITLGSLEVENLIEADTRKDGKIIEVDFADNPF